MMMDMTQAAILMHSKMCTLTSAGTAMKPHNCGNPRAAKINKD